MHVRACLPDLGHDPELNFGDLAQGHGRILDDLAGLLGLAPQLLSRLPGAFMHKPQLLSRLPHCFCILPYVLLLLPQPLRDTPYVFGAEPACFRVFPLHLGLLTTSFSLLTLCFRVLATWLICVHTALLLCTPHAAMCANMHRAIPLPPNLPVSDDCNNL
jgi:hypothetical protein